MNSPFRVEEVRSILRALPKRKSSGPDEVYYEHWSQSEPLLMDLLCDFFNEILSSGRMPRAWHIARLSLIFKGKAGDPRDDPNLYRGIASERTLKKIFCKLLIERVASVVNKTLPPEQFGFRRNMGTSDAIHVLQSEIERILSKPKGHLYAVFVDCVKAFDRAPRHLLVESFQRAGVGGALLNVIGSFFAEDTLLVEGSDEVLRVRQNVGTPQGDPLSCISFILLLADLVSFVRGEFRSTLVVMYADDIVVAHRDLGAIKRITAIVETFLRSRGLEINSRKTKAIKFRCGGSLVANDVIHCGG